MSRPVPCSSGELPGRRRRPLRRECHEARFSYENPLYFAEEAGALDLIADGRLALGVSRGSPEPADRGWESFGYTGSTDPRGADIAHAKFAAFLQAIRGEPMARAADQPYGAAVQPGQGLRIEPHSPDLVRRIWWGAGS